jgi:hypothetical protein
MANDIRELNANIRLRTSQKTANVVADAVIVEPVSAPKFPANREINREFFDFGLARGSEVTICLMIQRTWSKIPYSTEQGIFVKEQGIFTREQGI